MAKLETEEVWPISNLDFKLKKSKPIANPYCLIVKF